MQPFRPTSFKLLPDVVKNLMIINGLVYLGTETLGKTMEIDFAHLFGLHFYQSEYFKPWQLLTHLFMHGNLIHIFSNMFALWMFGNMIENIWGGKRFLIYYMITGLGAAFLHMVVMNFEISAMRNEISNFAATGGPGEFELLVSSYSYLFQGNGALYEQANAIYSAWQNFPGDHSLRLHAIDVLNRLVENKMNIPTVGASGAVFGVLLAFGMMFPNTIIYLYFAIPIKAKYFVMLYGFFELYAGFQNNPADNVAHFAHLGGMLFGFLLIKYWNRNRNYFY